MEEYAEIKAKFEAQTAVLKALLEALPKSGNETAKWVKDRFEELLKELK